MWKGNGAGSSWAMLSRDSLRRLHSLVCLIHFICCPSVYRQLYWFSLGKSLTWLSSSPPFLLIQGQMFKFTPTLQPQLPGGGVGGLRTGWGHHPGQRVLLDPCAGGFPLACLGNWGFIVCYVHAVLTGHTLKALPFPSEEGGWKMRTWKFCPFLLFLSLRMLCFRRMLDCTIVESCPA